MRELPILFSAPMVRAILEGRKTVTRRIVKPQPAWGSHDCDGILTFCHEWKGHLLAGEDARDWFLAQCPYGQPGDRLWVRETFGFVSHSWDDNENIADWVPDRPATPCRELPFGNGYYSGHVIYATDGPFEWAGDDDGGGEPRSEWKPSIHMPRAASRITLEVTGVRVERLQDISDDQCIAEGIDRDRAYPTLWRRGRLEGDQNLVDVTGFPKLAFRSIWEAINGASSWKANPWVWAVEFKRIEQERKVA